MGSQLEKVLDYEGKSYAIFDESSLYDDSQIGNKLEDFEILEVLNAESNESNPNFVAKVRSIKNHKIYALKRINMQEFNPNYYEQQIKNLIELNNPHLIKYYTYFFMNGFLFLVMEYMNNSDIDGFRKAHQVLGKDIKEEEIWNILLQCLSALDYVYNNFNNFFRFKISNIFMNNEQNAKIGLSHSKNNYSDIVLLGKCFYAMCFSREDNVKDKKFLDINDIQPKQNLYYSNELLNIIYTMLNDNNNVNISLLYNQVKSEYCKKYAKNSSINSVLRCLYSYPKLNQIICQNEQIFSSSQKKYFITYNYFNAIRTLQGAYENNLSEFIEEFRSAIAKENSKLDGSREIDPLYLLAFLLEKMHKEMNVIEENDLNEGEEVDRTNKEQTFSQFVNYINSNINSPISDLFLGINKTKRICQTCKNGYYSFNNFCFVIFDLTDNNYQNFKNFDLFNDGFFYQYNCEKKLLPDKQDRVSCEKCLTYQFHYEFNRYYVMSRQLIISFLRGNNYENNTRVKFQDKLDLSQLVDETDISQFYLVGCINRVVIQGKEEFIYWAKDPDNNLWHKSKINNMNQSSYLDEHAQLNIKEIMETGQIIILFYNEINNK
jgi:hypothetical protein